MDDSEKGDNALMRPATCGDIAIVAMAIAGALSNMQSAIYCCKLGRDDPMNNALEAARVQVEQLVGIAEELSGMKLKGV